MARHEQELYPPPSMKRPLVASGAFHLLIFTLATLGLPFMSKKTPVFTPPVNVEIVDIDEITQTNQHTPPQKKLEEPEKPAPPEEKELPPQVTADSPPDMTVPQPPEIEEIAEKPPEKKLEPVPEKPKAKPKPPEKKSDFASLLKNLAPDENDAPKTQEAAEEGGAAQMAPLADRLIISELDAFKRQIEPCWNVPSGAKYAEDLAVEIRVLMNPDMTMQSASILDQGRYNRDSHFRAAADSALRALQNPRCLPFKLPPDKYEQWKNMIINFDPQDIL